MRSALCTFSLLALTLPRLGGAAPCTDLEVKEVLATATAASPRVSLKCSLTLDGSGHVITKKIAIQGADASGITLDCAGSLIQPKQFTAADIEAAGSTDQDQAIRVRSNYNGDGTWSRPVNVTVKNCRVRGMVQTSGMRNVGDELIYTESSYLAGHTARVQAASPRGIVFDNLVVDGTGVKDPFYIGSGTTYSSILNSEIKGSISGVPLYLDAESGHNRIENNYIHAVTSHREQMAVDGSAHNKILRNFFSGLNHGGIYLYRNCGEKGVVRHQSPRRNEIINNSFYYNHYDGDLPSVWLGSRNEDPPGYCSLDAGYGVGSSASNLDYARYNVVAESQIYKLSVGKMIRNDDSPNYFFNNETVAISVSRPSGCFLSFGGSRQTFISHGETYAYRISETTGVLYACDDNRVSASILPAEKVTFGCRVTGSNAGCSGTRACPAGKQLMSVRTACNLEYGPVSDAELAATSWDRIQVVRASDNVSDGRCWVSSVSLSSGIKDSFPALGTATSFAYGCREHDENGGDCAIRGEALCL